MRKLTTIQIIQALHRDHGHIGALTCAELSERAEKIENQKRQIQHLERKLKELRAMHQEKSEWKNVSSYDWVDKPIPEFMGHISNIRFTKGDFATSNLWSRIKTNFAIFKKRIGEIISSR